MPPPQKQPNQNTALAERKTVSSIVPHNIDELIRMAEILYRAGLGAKAGADRPEGVAAIILAGLEIGLKPGQALTSIYLQGGRATLYGPMPLAMVRASGLLEYFEEKLEGEGEDRAAICTARRKGDTSPPRVQRFSISDARRAGLLDRAKDKGKGAGAWITWQDRMLTFRARTPVLQDLFGDVLAGFDLADERPEPEPREQPTRAEIEVRPAAGPAAGPATEPAVGAFSSPPPGTGGGSPGMNGAPATAPPATDVHGETMIDDGQLRDVVRLLPAWLKVYGPNPPAGREDNDRAWAGMLTEKYGVASARKLTESQAGELLAVMRAAEANPTGALFAPPAPAAEGNGATDAAQQQHATEPTPAAA